ncbi:CFC_collapsed_G0008520.mRNA.1.CDS.1 [Saccharomyces cerevisiae]|nr:CFC_collapsed_G0008520.mRNA.1.CDS.1 [Saccharomyces cerevisiae]
MFKVPVGLASRTRELMNSVTLNSLNNGKGFNMYLPGILRAFPKPVPSAITSPAIPKYRGESFQFRKLSCISSNYCSTTHQFLSSLKSSTSRLVGKRAFHSSRRAEIKFIFSSKSPKNGNKPFVKKNIFYKDVLTSLPKTKLKITLPTMRSLQLQPMVQSWKEISSRMGIPNEFAKGLNVDLVKQEETRKQFLSFLQKRVLESFTKNELGIRSYFLGDSVEKWIKESYDLELDIDNCRSELRKFQTFIFSSVRYKLYLDSMKNLPLNPSKKLEGKKHIADVYVIILDESFPAIMFNGGAYSKADFFKILQESETSNSSKTLNTIIAIKSVNTLLSKHFVITTNGDSGEFFFKI